MGNVLLTGSRLKEVIQEKTRNEKLTYSGYSIAKMIDIAERLRNELCTAIIEVIPSFNTDLIQVQPPIKNLDDSYAVKIFFPDEAMQRKSLWIGGNNKDMGYTGSGVYDIVGLFSMGYTSHRRVFGYWVGHENNQYYASKTHREPNDFVANVITAFKSKYPDIKIKYPQEWGNE